MILTGDEWPWGESFSHTCGTKWLYEHAHKRFGFAQANARTFRSPTYAIIGRRVQAATDSRVSVCGGGGWGGYMANLRATTLKRKAKLASERKTRRRILYQASDENVR